MFARVNVPKRDASPDDPARPAEILGESGPRGYGPRMIYRFFTVLLTFFAFAGSPAWAGTVGNGGTAVDEPAALALMAVGVVGLIIGRQAARRRD